MGYVCPSPDLDVRLRRRYYRLVSQHLSVTDAAAAGLRALPGEATAFACTQAAWRFFANPCVTAPALVEPLLECARRASRELSSVALIVQDFSQLNFVAHTRKRDRKPLNGSARGYGLLTSLLISDRDGAPLAPVAMSLWARDGIHTSRRTDVLADAIDIDEASVSMVAIEAIGLERPCVYVFDREWDSIWHLRQWASAGRHFLVRARAGPKAVFEGESMPLGEVAERLQLRSAQAVALNASVVGQQFVAETRVRLERRALRMRSPGRRIKNRRWLAGTPLELRLIVSVIRSPDETEVARWLLLTNVGEQVPAEQIAEWYCWRWKIESYFKLLKGSGQHVEQWQQESADAVLKRLLVSAMAAVTVWQVARSEGAQAEATRALLVRLSGRQQRRDRPWTEPALLSGMWVLLAALDALEHYRVDDLRQMACHATLGITRYGSVKDDSS